MFKAITDFSSATARSIYLILYDLLTSRLIKKRETLVLEFKNLDLSTELLKFPKKETKKRIWFHASSMEFESLWPVLENMDKLSEPIEVIVSMFSTSSFKLFLKQATRFSDTHKNVKICALGFCPSEKNWKQTLQESEVDAFVTVRYEAWPFLWGALSKLGIPLFLIGAQWRPSLKILLRLNRIFGFSLPKAYFLPFNKFNQVELADHFDKKLKLNQVLADPRWDRVENRAAIGNSRANEILNCFNSKDRVGVIGSVWPSDWPIIKSALLNEKGTYILVPHDVSFESQKNWKKLLNDENISVFIVNQSADLSKLKNFIESDIGKIKFIAVFEMGYLLELYSKARWVYVGGGFESGIHSTLEPAYFGVPVAFGPKRSELFSETRELLDTGQGFKVFSAQDFADFLIGVKSLDAKQEVLWKNMIQAKAGASIKIVDLLMREIT